MTTICRPTIRRPAIAARRAGTYGQPQRSYESEALPPPGPYAAPGREPAYRTAREPGQYGPPPGQGQYGAAPPAIRRARARLRTAARLPAGSARTGGRPQYGARRRAAAADEDGFRPPMGIGPGGQPGEGRARHHVAPADGRPSGDGTAQGIAAAVPAHDGRVPHPRAGRHHHHRHREHVSLSRARQRPGDPLRHRRRPRRLHLGRRRARHPDGRVAGLASAGGDDRAPALPAALHGRRRRQPARRARALSRQDDLPHPRHQSAVDHRLVRVVGLHPSHQRGRHRPLLSREGRHPRGGACRASRRRLRRRAGDRRRLRRRSGRRQASRPKTTTSRSRCSRRRLSRRAEQTSHSRLPMPGHGPGIVVLAQVLAITPWAITAGALSSSERRGPTPFRARSSSPPR